MAEHPDHQLYIGKVMHLRRFPVAYRFTYRVFTLLLDIDRLETLNRLRGFSLNRFNLFAFHSGDHGPRDGSSLRHWAEAVLAERGIDLAGGRIRLQCFPRILGYGFNPISAWYCEHADGSLRAVIAEVHNTFGEQHSYVLANADGNALSWDQQHDKPKCFHVSPFVQMQADYRFHFRQPDELLRLQIDEFQDDAHMLTATWHGHRKPFTSAALAKLALAFPLMTIKIMAAIHWQAIKIRLKGARFYSKPAPPKELTS